MKEVCVGTLGVTFQQPTSPTTAAATTADDGVVRPENLIDDEAAGCALSQRVRGGSSGTLQSDRGFGHDARARQEACHRDFSEPSGPLALRRVDQLLQAGGQPRRIAGRPGRVDQADLEHVAEMGLVLVAVGRELHPHERL